MNCITERCMYAKMALHELENTEYFKRVYIPYCELGKSISYPFIDNGKKDMRCANFKRASKGGGIRNDSTRTNT